MLSSATLLFYRGYLHSCNYNCGYCPFAKKKMSQEALEKDQKALAQFFDYIACRINPIALFFTPYGEAMVHDYYLERLAQLTSLTQVTRVGIQTNNSFSIAKLLKALDAHQGIKQKLTLWCSWHPTEVRMEAFIRQCQRLKDNDIEFSVGCVADRNGIEGITSLWQKLPEGTPRWLNRYVGQNEPYSTEDIAYFTQLDPLFGLEISHPLARPEQCHGGQSHFLVQGNGDIFPCHSSKQRLGNLYQQTFLARPCKQKRCSCFLAYACRQDLPQLAVFKGAAPFRIKNNPLFL